MEKNRKAPINSPPFDRNPCMGEEHMCKNYIIPSKNPKTVPSGCLNDLGNNGKYAIPDRFIVGYKCFVPKN